jgi:hypothetical protein
MKGVIFMKLIKTIIILSLLLVTLCGCIQVHSGTPPAQTNAEDEYGISEAPAFVISHDRVADGDFRTAIINEIRASSSRSDVARRLNDIKEFYAPLEIDGYGVYSIAFWDSGVSYNYMPNEDLLRENTHWYFSETTCIEVVIDCPMAIARTDYANNAAEFFEMIVRENNMTLIDDNLAVFYNHVFGLMDDRTFRVSVPTGLAINLTSQDLARDLISTAELVNVDEEIARLSQ